MESTTVSQEAVIVENSTDITVDIGTLEAGTAHAICLITYRVTINNPFYGATDNLTNQGVVKADGITEQLTIRGDEP
mgnify:CR=1 FL=1